MRTSRRLVARFSAASRATRSSLTTIRESPADGTSYNPMISTGTEGPAFLSLFAFIVDERADFAERSACDDDVADAQRSILHEHGRNRTASPMERGFDYDARCAAITVGFEIA